MSRELAHKMQYMKKHEPEKLYAMLSELPEDKVREILYDPELWLRDDQLVKDEWPEPIIMFMAGRG